jgi:predicted 3-demethylubiquinone-9 3-methyltransferase (glyoxalase superfamily)
MELDQGITPGIEPDDDTSVSESLQVAEAQAMTVTDDGDMLLNGFVFTPIGLVPANPDAPPDFEDWDRTGVFLRYIHTGTQFWLGDWLNYGESHYGEKYAQAVEHTGYELHTLQTYAWVASKVPRANRLESVPFGHYANGLAALPPDEQAEWVQKVAKEGMTQSAMKAALVQKRAAAGQKPVDLWLVVKCKDQADFDKLEKQMTSQGREVTSRVTVQRKPKVEKTAKKKTGSAVTQKPIGTPKKAKAKRKDAPTLKVTKGAQEQIDQIAADLKNNNEIDPGWLKDEFYIPPPTEGETPEERQKRRKKINNARARAKDK